MRNYWTICWGSFTVAIILDGTSKWYYGKATIVTALASTGDQATRTLATAAHRYLQTGTVFAVAGLVAAMVGCIAWGVSIKRKEAGTVVLPMCLLAAYAMLYLVMV